MFSDIGSACQRAGARGHCAPGKLQSIWELLAFRPFLWEAILIRSQGANASVGVIENKPAGGSDEWKQDPNSSSPHPLQPTGWSPGKAGGSEKELPPGDWTMGCEKSALICELVLPGQLSPLGIPQELQEPKTPFVA